MIHNVKNPDFNFFLFHIKIVSSHYPNQNRNRKILQTLWNFILIPNRSILHLSQSIFSYIKLNLVFNVQNFRQWKTQSITSTPSTTETNITGTTRTWITNTTTTNLASMTNIIRTCITSITLPLIWYISFLFSACEWCYRRGWCRTNEKVGIIFHYMDLSKYV